MLQDKLDKKINSLLKIKESVDISPPIQVFNTPPSLQLPQVPQVNLVELMNKQTEMILALIKELADNQNLILKQIMDKQTITMPSPQKEEFKEKVINIRFDEKGNPVGAEIKLKAPDESRLDLATLESQSIIEGIEIPT